MKSPLIIVCCLLMVCVFATAQEPCPQVIPALQQWKGGKGELALPAEGSIVLSPADEATLSPTAQILAQDLKELCHQNRKTSRERHLPLTVETGQGTW